MGSSCAVAGAGLRVVSHFGAKFQKFGSK